MLYPSTSIAALPNGVFSVPTFVVLVTAAFFLLVTLLARRKSKARGNSVLFVGPPDGGKTAILSVLTFKQALPTHSSLQTNASLIVLPQRKKTLRVVDIPGHPRIRPQYREYFSEAKAVVFVIDASTISRNGAAVAEHLHQILHTFMSLAPSQPSPAFLILAHKCDLLTATSSSGPPDQLAINRVRAILERELEKRRQSQVGGMGVESLGGEGDGSELSGLECRGSGGGAFRFSDWDGGEIVFLGTSIAMKEGMVEEEKAPGSDNGLNGLQQWLEDLP